jgi:hypothetical protein
MKLFFQRIPVFLVSIITIVFLLPAFSAAGQGATAKAELEKARAKAKGWKADAVLLGINTSKADKDGKAFSQLAMAGLGWTFIFRSDSAKKNFFVAIGGNGMDAKEVPVTSAKAMTGDFIDSEKAMAVAVRNGFDPANRTDISMAINQGSCPKNSGESLCWKIKGRKGGYYAVSGTSGKFLGTSGF